MRGLKTLILPIVNISLVLWLLRNFSEESRLAEIENKTFETDDISNLAEHLRDTLIYSLEHSSYAAELENLSGEVGVVYSVDGLIPAELETLDKAIEKLGKKDFALVADNHGQYAELKLSRTILYSVPEELLLADELTLMARAETKNKNSTSDAFHLMLVDSLHPKLLVNINRRNFAQVQKLLPKISEKAATWTLRKDWALLILGQDDLPAIQALHPQYFKKLAHLCLMAPEIDLNHLAIRFIDLKMCSQERKFVSFRHPDPYHCARNSGLVKYDLY
ncbi:Oidioi.mRNA.OKI2018_I69.XSR.g14203.t1.cds [Oikopleura dioica]|uniref:Oidioi.mRNA.OKI2018_I69.XSR.g14203.t1.cds n=1 Tax=Oikopleura dioica TaxID=34765 RepID=A0ABN7SD08_OIKDI|nr:Oidioi.mRNA.OKI2018_I69.XSR.g14203.t1.cds [Oikopleura dioica]